MRPNTSIKSKRGNGVVRTRPGLILGAAATSKCWSLLGNYDVLVKHTENMLRGK